MFKTEVKFSLCAVNKPLAVQGYSSIADKLLDAIFFLLKSHQLLFAYDGTETVCK